MIINAKWLTQIPTQTRLNVLLSYSIPRWWFGSQMQWWLNPKSFVEDLCLTLLVCGQVHRCSTIFYATHEVDEGIQFLPSVIRLYVCPCARPSVIRTLTLSLPNFRRHCRLLFFFNYRLKRSLYVKLKDGMSNNVDPDETAHMYRLIWTYAVCKSLLLSPVAVKV